MKYHRKLERATTVEEVQEIYNEEFKNMVAKIEEQFAAEGRGQQLVYADSCIDPSLTITDTHLLTYTENQVEQLSKDKSEGLTIGSNHDSFIAERLEELRKEMIVNDEKTRD